MTTPELRYSIKGEPLAPGHVPIQEFIDRYWPIETELHRAESMHEWPTDLASQWLIVTEEFGEASKEVNEVHFKGKSKEALRTEVIQSMAMHMRFLKNLED